MVRLYRFLLIFLALMCGSRPVFAATSPDERAFRAAAQKFQRTGFMDFAANDFAAFVTNYPNSSHVPEAILYQAEAAITGKRFTDAITLLSANQNRAGSWGDKFLYWTAQAHLGNTNYSAAADTFARLIREFPGSTNCLEASVGEASARANLKEWPRVIELLQPADSVFQRSARGSTNEQAAAGYLLLGEAQLAQKDYAGGDTTLQWLATQSPKPEFVWRRLYLRCRLEKNEEKLESALQNTTNLVTLSSIVGDARLRAQSFMLQAEILEAMNRPAEAIGTYKSLAASAPVDEQRHALLKIAEISLSQTNVAEVIKTLENYWEQHPTAEAADIALLTIGELQLKQYPAIRDANPPDLSSATNLLKQALDRFDSLLKTFTNSPYIGKAFLDRGWCLWELGRYAECLPAFRAAAGRLPFSEDQAIARFKWADAQFMLKDFNGAITNYAFLPANYAEAPEVASHLIEPALYQSVRAAIAVSNMLAATEAMEKILKWFPNSFTGDRCLLAVGEGYTQQNDPAKAREIFTLFESRSSSTHPLLPEVRLAIARTYEKERDWPAAITHLENWLLNFTNHAELPRAEFSLAWDTSMAGQGQESESNALVRFQRFVAQRPAHELAPNAQWWIGDYYFRGGRFLKAEESYQDLFTKWTNSDLACQAQMMAGNAAVALLNYKDAIRHFTNLFNNPACPPDLKVQAALETGEAFMARSDPSATNRRPDLEEALRWFTHVAQNYPTNTLAPRASARRADCYKELGAFDPQYYGLAEKEYQQAITNSALSFALRNQARIGLGVVAEKRADAERAPGPEKTAFLEHALEYYVDAFTRGQDPPDGEPPDLFGVREAGLKAIRLAEQLQRWERVVDLCSNLRDLIPPLRTLCDNRRLKAQERLGAQK
jgi:tetratricopeptide (TPR) repeat protein